MSEVVGEPLTLRTTNVNQPILQHSASQQSITASEDYQSATSGEDRASSAASNTRPAAEVNRMSALQSHPHHHESQPLHPTDGPGADSFQPSTRSTFDRLQGASAQPQRRSDPIRRKPVGSGSNQITPPSSSDSSNDKVSENVADAQTRQRGSAPSPSNGDDTPYLRFALDQLTRDEEVRGSRRYPNRDRWSTQPGAVYGAYPPSSQRGPSVRDGYDQGAQRGVGGAAYAPQSSYYDPSVSSGSPSNGQAYPRNASRSSYPPQATYNAPSSGLPQGTYTQHPPRESSYAPKSSYVLPAAAAAATAVTAPVLARRFSSGTEDDEVAGYVTPEEDSSWITSQAVQPTIETSPEATRMRSSPSGQSDVFVPFDQEVPALRFLPGILRPLWLLLYIFLLLLVLVGLLFSGIFSSLRNGLFDYTDFGGARYFVFQYLPLLISMFLLLWLFQIQIAVQRIAPFIAMASYNAKSRSEALLMEYQPTNFILPKLFYFSAGQPIIGTVMFIFWLQIFDIPLFACLYNVYFYGAAGSGSWRWLTTQAIVWTLFGLYFLLTVALIVLGIWVWRQRTGLRWDPRSLADVVALLDRSNVFHDYYNSETFKSHGDFRQRLEARSDRLGYWTTSNRPDSAFYGIGEEGGPTRRYSVERGQVREKSPEASRSGPPSDRPTALEFISAEADDESHRLKHQYLPWYLKTTWALLWVVAGILLFLAFLIVSFINDATLRGFHPLLPVAPDVEGFSSTNFLYSFIPTIIAQLIFLSWLSVDYAFRRLQPFAGLSASKHDTIGGSAQQTLLLDYTSRLPISVTIAAVLNGNLRVAWFSLVSLITACLPILAGGCFWAQFYIPTQEVRVAVNPSAFYALCVFLALIAFSLPLMLFGMQKRRLPHSCTTLADQISWLYASQLLGEREWRALLGSKTEMATRLINANTRQERELGGGHFYFGRFTGRDGRTHIGIDRIGRDSRTSQGPRWRHQDPSGSLTTPPRGEKSETSAYYPRSNIRAPGNPAIGRSGSGRFVPVAAGAGAAAGAATLATVYDDEKPSNDSERQDLMPRQPPAALVGRERDNDVYRYESDVNRLSESDKPALAREREARQSSNYPSGSSNYLSYTAAMQPSSTMAPTNPFADPIEERPVSPMEDDATAGQSDGTVRRMNTDPKWYQRSSGKTTTQAQDSMADLAEGDKAEHVRNREGGSFYRSYIGSAR